MFSFLKFQKENKMASNDSSHSLSRQPTIHHISASMEDLDSELSNVEYATYSVHIPPTPDHQPLDCNSRGREEQFVWSSLFTGGHNRATRALSKDKVIGSETSHPLMVGSKGSFCSIPGCNSRITTDAQGEDVLPCDCDFKICEDCYRDALRTGDGICPGCKEAYGGEQDLVEMSVDNKQKSFDLERRLSLVKSTESRLVRNQNNEFDYTDFLYETKKSYGYGNAVWPKDDVNEDNGGVGGEPKEFSEKQWKPLTRKLNVSTKILFPYRYDICSFFFFCFVNILFMHIKG